ncbi:MAG: type II 3-dehydroquinate dehydratase [Christensenellaceae bacterium]|nr:type II 3-dehydroquinate dehydratase [Christensenellaceae bacterium]
MNIIIINGPNLNMLGIREPNLYGSATLADLENKLLAVAEKLNVNLAFYQSNHEGKIIDVIQESLGKFDGIIINAGGYTHTSIAIMDALKAVNLPTVEVHLTAIETREDFRQKSYISLVAKKIITGKGFDSYIDALNYLVKTFS